MTLVRAPPTVAVQTNVSGGRHEHRGDRDAADPGGQDRGVRGLLRRPGAAGAGQRAGQPRLSTHQDPHGLTHHGGTDYFKATGPKFAAVLAGRPDIEYLDGVA